MTFSRPGQLLKIHLHIWISNKNKKLINSFEFENKSKTILLIILSFKSDMFTYQLLYGIFQKNIPMKLDPLQAQFEQIKIELIPNLHTLDPHVQQQVIKILHFIIKPDCQRNHLTQISRLNLLEETPLLRSHIWKMLIGTSQLKRDKWRQSRQRNEQLYSALRQKFCPTEVHEDSENVNMNFENFDKELWDQITLDTKRTHSTINFFQSQVSFTKVYSYKITKHSDILNRILYIWSRTNSAVRYVQGMNQIVAPLYYLEFQETHIIHWDRQSEVFAMFAAIMSSVIDMHIKQMDDCESGIMGRMIFLNRFLRIVDESLWRKMEKQGIYPECYSFRWLALLLAQQFGIYDTIRLWDFILSYDEDNRFFFVYSLCISVLQIRRQIILQNDFTVSLPLIQKLRDMDIEEVIEKGTEIFTKFKNVKINEQFSKLVTKDNQASLENDKVTQIHLKSGSWSYADILKHAGSYMEKLTNFGK